MSCPLCVPPEPEAILWRDAQCRVVHAQEPLYPGYCRVVWRAHVREMTDLDPGDRARLMDIVYAVERALRDLLGPAKINLAALGNRVPHVHWHVIPRFENDAHFPDAIWAPARRSGVAPAVDLALLGRHLARYLGPTG